MKKLPELLRRNREWADGISAADPEFFPRLAEQQNPEYLWIGCSDSRVPANQIVGLPPGAVFVHRNVANVVAPGDLNLLTVVQYAVDVLGVQHLIVCGHYGCGGVQATFEGRRVGLADNWLRHVHRVAERHYARLDAIDDPARKLDRLTELNVIEQLRELASTTVVQDAWRRGQTLSVHGWVYGMHNGRLRDLGFGAEDNDSFVEMYMEALQQPAPQDVDLEVP